MSLTNADLAQQVTSLISRWDTYTKQLRDWLAGTPDGGPYGDGRYPLQNSLGQVFYVPCPAAQSAMVEGNAASAESFATQAAAHALAAAGAKAAAETARDLALTYRDAAQAAKALAETARNEAQTAEANARYWAEQAQATAGGVNSVAADVAEAADTVAADRAAAEAARVAAEAAQVAAELAAQQAATFNPANYAPVNHTHAIADVTGLQAALDGKLSTTAAAAAAAKLETPRTLQIGNTGKPFDGTTNVTWTLADIGAAAASHTHSASDITSGTLSDARLPSTMSGKTFTGDVSARAGLFDRGGTGPDTSPTLRARAGVYSISFIPWVDSGWFNPMVQAGDSLLVYDAGASNSGALTITQWSSTAKGLRIAADGVTAFSHTPTFPTASPGDNSTKGATTAFVQAALANKANSSHTHTIADVSGLQATLNGKMDRVPGDLFSDANALSGGNWMGTSSTGTPANTPTGEWTALLHSTNSDGSWGYQLAKPYFQDELYLRSIAGGNKGNWLRLWHAGNLNPASFAAASHSHTIADVSGLQAALDAKVERVLEYNSTDANSLPAGNWMGNFLGGSTTNTPNGSWTHFLQSTNSNKTWGFQLAKPWFNHELYLRSLQDGGWSNWFRIWHSGNLDASVLNQGGRLGPNSKTISNWNDAVENGYYTALNAANSPINDVWLMGRVVSHNSLWVEQEVWAFTDGGIPQPRWVRVKRDGTWSAWNRWGARLGLEDTRYTMPQPNQFVGRVRHWDFKHQNDTGAGGRGWHVVLTVAPWLDYQYDHPQQQLVWRGDGLSYRSAVDGATWGPYKHLVTSPQAATEIFVQANDPGAVGAGKVWIKPV